MKIVLALFLVQSALGLSVQMQPDDPATKAEVANISKSKRTGAQLKEDSSEELSFGPTRGFGKACDAPEGAVFHAAETQLQDKHLYERYFCDRTDGVFVELGANTGMSGSISKFYEDHLGWDGVLIEANPEHTDSLLTNRGKGKSKVSIHTKQAICASGQGFISFATESKFGEDSAGDVSLDPYAKGRASTLDIPCEPIADLFQKDDIKAIDLFVLDVEGSELKVLETFDFSIPVKVFLIEMDGKNKEKDQNVRDLLTQHGYHMPEDGWNIRDECVRHGKWGLKCSIDEVWVHQSLH